MPEEKQMQAIAISAFGGPERLTLMHLPVPMLAQHEVLIRVQAAGVGMWDVKVRQGKVPLDGMQFPFVLGWESVGVIEQVGPNVTRWHVGDTVISFTEQQTLGITRNMSLFQPTWWRLLQLLSMLSTLRHFLLTVSLLIKP